MPMDDLITNLVITSLVFLSWTPTNCSHGSYIVEQIRYELMGIVLLIAVTSSICYHRLTGYVSVCIVPTGEAVAVLIIVFEPMTPAPHHESSDFSVASFTCSHFVYSTPTTKETVAWSASADWGSAFVSEKQTGPSMSLTESSLKL